jgi:alkanesulfonate monooxygenase SsuD/methylene tetrahydromethanopterin reductase-like flavin-dependent oxidoreductase (luciferase family)
VNVEIILDGRARAGDLAELGQLAERYGIGGVWVSSLNDSRDPFTNFVPLALATTGLRMGPIAVNPFDTHPLKIAASLLTLNELARGRARIVIGGGGEALQALGIRPARRVRAVAECVEILRAASAGQSVHYKGQIYTVANCRFGWIESPLPPIYVGAGQEQMLRTAARVADGIMMSDMPPAPARRTLAMLDGFLAQHGRCRPAFWSSVFTAWHVYPDVTMARREARRWLLLRGIFRPWLLAEFLDEVEVQLVMASQPAFLQAFMAGSHDVHGVPDRVLDALVDHVTLCGSSERLDPLIAQLRNLKDAGLGSVALRLYTDPATSIRLIGERVVPALV